MSDDEITYDSGQDEKAQALAQALAQLQELRQQHRHLDDEITALQQNGVTDMLKIARLKKFKLKLKDQISRLEDKVTPDIIA